MRQPLLPSALFVALASLAASLPAQAGSCRDLGGGKCAATYNPILRCSGQPNIGCSNFALHLLNLGFTFPSGTLFLGTCGKKGIPFPGCAQGCEIQLDRILVGLPFQADRFGTAFFPTPAPNNTSLVGVTLCGQALRSDARCPVLSNGLEVKVGRGDCR